MHSKWVFKHFRARTGRRLSSLVILWALSLVAGILICALSAHDLDAVFRFAFTASPALPGKVLVCILPVAVTAVALLSPIYVLIYPVVFFSGISRGFCGCMIYMAQGNAAWLLRPILLFYAGCWSVLMWWLILQDHTGRPIHKHIRLASILSCITCIVDLFVVSPLIGDLSKYF